MLSDASLPMPSKIKWVGAVESKGNLSIKVSKVRLASHCDNWKFQRWKFQRWRWQAIATIENCLDPCHRAASVQAAGQGLRSRALAAGRCYNCWRPGKEKLFFSQNFSQRRFFDPLQFTDWKNAGKKRIFQFKFLNFLLQKYPAVWGTILEYQALEIVFCGVFCCSESFFCEVFPVAVVGQSEQ